MIIEEIQKIKKLELYNEQEIYLINAINHESGFLLNKNKVMFIIKNNEKLDKETIHTEILTLITNIHISSLNNEPSFKSDEYNILIFNGDVSSELFDTYVELCITYVNSHIKIAFLDFFYSLISLFQLPKESKYKNLIGLFGELSFIIIMFQKYGLDISNEWHSGGSSYDKYDFCFNKFNLEIKSTISNNEIFHIKHNQIFNEQNNYIIVININEDISGNSLDDIYNFLKEKSPFKNNLSLQIKLNEEKRRVDPNQMKNKKYRVNSYKVFYNKQLKTITNIPDGIYELEYKYDFSNLSSIDLCKIIEIIKSNAI